MIKAEGTNTYGVSVGLLMSILGPWMNDKGIEGRLWAILRIVQGEEVGELA